MWIKDPQWLVVGMIPALISQFTLRYIAARNRKAEHLAALDSLGRHLSGGLSNEEVLQQEAAIDAADAAYVLARVAQYLLDR